MSLQYIIFGMNIFLTLENKLLSFLVVVAGSIRFFFSLNCILCSLGNIETRLLRNF